MILNTPPKVLSDICHRIYFKENHSGQGIVSHAYNSNYWGDREASPGKDARPYSKNK
jgi:hypothetical protein